MKKFPKILIIGRNVWTNDESTLTNIFKGYNCDSLAYIYIETKNPNTDGCHRFFQISEGALIGYLLNKKIKTGKEISDENYRPSDTAFSNRENKIMKFVRNHRSVLFSIAREILWAFNGWKTKELDSFIYKFNPDVVFLMGDPLPLMNKLQNYIIKKANKPAAIFMMDDFYTYKSSFGLLAKIYKTLTRIQVKKNIKFCSKHFAISPKMKSEYDKIFGIDCILLTKGIDFNETKYEPKPVGKPITMVYMGKLIYGRYDSLVAIVKALKEINRDQVKLQLYIYTSDHVNNKQLKELTEKNISFLMKPVSYSKVKPILKLYDVVVFVESFEKRYREIARLSFSTKLVDYMACSRLIFAIGPKNIAPIEYLKNEDAALIAINKEEIKNNVEILLNDMNLIDQYSRKAFNCARMNHDIIEMNKKMLNEICKMEYSSSALTY